ncbi:MAG: DMT family transporter [Bacteroidetes bacterium]|nr:DMT family transporter [Bacteroidota bacterium]
MQRQTLAYLYALSAILFWSTMGTAFKLTLRFLDPPSLLLISSLTAIVFLGIIILITGKYRSLSELKIKDYSRSALMGLFNPFLYYLVLFKAYSMIQAQEAVALNYIWPVMLVVFSMLFLKQRIGLVSLLAILLSFSGTFVIATHGNITSFRFTNPLGAILATGSSIFWASFFVLNMKDKREAYSKMFLNFCFGFLYILLWNLSTGHMSLPSFTGLGGAVYIGIFEMGLTFVLWLTALNLSSTTARVSNLVYLSPFLSLLMVSVFVGEKILVSTVVGLFIIVSGILLQQWSFYRNKYK